LNAPAGFLWWFTGRGDFFDDPAERREKIKSILVGVRHDVMQRDVNL